MPARKACGLASMFVSVLAAVCPVADAPAGGQAAAGNPGNPAPFPLLQSVQFSCPKIASQVHPFLFITKQDAAEARERITQKEYSAAWRFLNEESKKAGRLLPEPIDRSWWDEVKGKPWSETYPVIYQKTCLDPLRIVLPAYYAALNYEIAGTDEDLDAARKILLHLADYSFEFEHYDVGMNYAVWGHYALNAYDMMFDHFSVAERAGLDKFFTRMARAILKNDIYWIENDIGGGINNHLAWHKMMLGCLGVFYDREDLIEYALHGRRGLVSLLDEGMVDKGLWCESSLNYHFTAIVPMVYFAQALRNTGYAEDLYKITTPAGRNIRQAYDSMFGVLFPDGSVPPIGDAYARRMRLADEFTYLYAHKAYRDPRYAWLLKKADHKRPETLFIGIDTKQAVNPNITSRLYEEHGYAFLRDRADDDYWDSDGWCAFLTFDKSGVHCNQDKLSLMLFGRGKLLIPDVEAKATVPHAFSAKIQQQLNRSALSQNTVMVDNRDQKGIGEVLTLVEFRDGPDEKSVTAADLKGLLYEGVRQSRTIVVTADYVLDVFQIAAQTEHDIKWIIHTIGTGDSQRSSVALRPGQVKLPGPGSWLRDFRTATTDQPIRLELSEDLVNFAVTMAAVPGTRLITCGYPTTDEPNCPTTPMVLIERRAAATIYAAVYQAAKQQLPTVQIEQFEDAADRLTFSVSGPWGRCEHSVPRLR